MPNSVHGHTFYETSTMKHRHIQPDPQDLKEARSQIRRLVRELKAADQQIDALQKAAGLEVIDGYEPDSRLERMYGWLYTVLPITGIILSRPTHWKSCAPHR